MVITSVSQTDDVGSIPAIRSGHLSRYIYLTALAFFFFAGMVSDISLLPRTITETSYSFSAVFFNIKDGALLEESFGNYPGETDDAPSLCCIKM